MILKEALFMEHFKERFTKWMQGRYGGDQLSLALLILCLILMVFTLPFHSPLLRLLPLIPLVLCYFRIFSKNKYKRQQELFKFIRFYTPIQKRINLSLKHLKERKTHRFFKCPKCKQTLRVPKGKGNICITCPKCHTDFRKHT